MSCGFDPRTGNKHCPNCGVEVGVGQVVCIKCGVSLNTHDVADSNAKDKTTYLVLAIFLGSLGIHNFYAGYTAKGVIQLCITLCSCGVLAIVSSIWGIIEGVTVENDASGKPFRR